MVQPIHRVLVAIIGTTTIASTASAAITGYEVERLEGAVPGTAVVRLYGVLGDPTERAWASGTLEAGIAAVAPAERSLVQLEVDTRRGTATMEALAAFRAESELRLGLGRGADDGAARGRRTGDGQYELDELEADPFGLGSAALGGLDDLNPSFVGTSLDAALAGLSVTEEFTVIADASSDIDLAAALGLDPGLESGLDVAPNGAGIGGLSAIPVAPAWAFLAVGLVAARRRGG